MGEEGFSGVELSIILFSGRLRPRRGRTDSKTRLYYIEVVTVTKKLDFRCIAERGDLLKAPYTDIALRRKRRETMS